VRVERRPRETAAASQKENKTVVCTAGGSLEGPTAAQKRRGAEKETIQHKKTGNRNVGPFVFARHCLVLVD
jgi:hypothetical protein